MVAFNLSILWGLCGLSCFRFITSICFWLQFVDKVWLCYCGNCDFKAGIIDCALWEPCYILQFCVFCHQAGSTKRVACRQISRHGCSQFGMGRWSAASGEPSLDAGVRPVLRVLPASTPGQHVRDSGLAKLPVFVSSLSSLVAGRQPDAFQCPWSKYVMCTLFLRPTLRPWSFAKGWVGAGLACLLWRLSHPWPGCLPDQSSAFMEFILPMEEGDLYLRTLMRPVPLVHEGCRSTTWMLFSFVFHRTISIRYSLIISFILSLLPMRSLLVDCGFLWHFLMPWLWRCGFPFFSAFFFLLPCGQGYLISVSSEIPVCVVGPSEGFFPEYEILEDALFILWFHHSRSHYGCLLSSFVTGFHFCCGGVVRSPCCSVCSSYLKSWFFLLSPCLPCLYVLRSLEPSLGSAQRYVITMFFFLWLHASYVGLYSYNLVMCLRICLSCLPQ